MEDQNGKATIKRKKKRTENKKNEQKENANEWARPDNGKKRQCYTILYQTIILTYSFSSLLCANTEQH